MSWFILCGFILCGFIWFVVGVASYIFWWTTDYDFRTGEVPIAIGAGVIGPLAFALGFLIHGNYTYSSRVIFKKRTTTK